MNRLRLNVILIGCGLFLASPLVVQAQSKPDKRLQQKISIKVEKKSALEVVKELGEKYKIPVDLDPSLAAEGIVAGQTEGSFSLAADGVSLGAVIHMACESLDVTYRIEKGRLLLTTKSAESEKMVVHEHPLGPLEGVADHRVLAMCVEQLTSGQWEDVDGEGGKIMEATPQSLTIRQTAQVHAEVRSLFDQIAAAVAERAPAAPAQDRSEQVILRKLQTPSLFAGKQTALPELLEQLLKKNGISFWIDETALADEGIDWTKLESTVEAKKVPTAARLDAIVAEHKLSWRIADEVVQITTATKSNEQMTIRVYDIRRSSNPDRPATAVAEQLTANKDLGPWQSEEGGGGTIMPFGSLVVIRQNAKSHAKIAKLFK